MSKLIYADTNKYDSRHRLILTTRGTVDDLERHGINLEDNLSLTFYMDDADQDNNPDNLIFRGTVYFDSANQYWVAEIDWNKIKNRSKLSVDEKISLGLED